MTEAERRVLRLGGAGWVRMGEDGRRGVGEDGRRGVGEDGVGEGGLAMRCEGDGDGGCGIITWGRGTTPARRPRGGPAPATLAG
mgnify:CR=1 FL=1